MENGKNQRCILYKSNTAHTDAQYAKEWWTRKAEVTVSYPFTKHIHISN